MPTSYSTLLGLALPVTGELSGTWGDEVNNYITQYLDSAVAGVQTISGSQTAVTLSRTTNAALSQAGSGSTGSSQYQIINCTGNPASALTITVPSTSKVYVVLNNTSTNQTVTVKPSAAAGVTVAAARAALIAWNGTDFELVATDDASKISGILAVANGGTGLSSGTSGGVPYFSGSTTMASSAALAANALVVGGGAGAAPSTVTTGTGVVTALGVNTGSAGAFVVNGGALGTPSSGTVTNLTGTASININGTVGATTPNTGSFTTLAASSTVSGTGFTNYFASPPAIGGTAANTGAFTTLTATSASVTGASGVLTRAAATQDGVEMIGRAGGTLSYKVSITPTTLTASRTVTLPDANIDFTTGLAVANGGTGSTTASGARTNLGATTVGGNFFTLTNPSAITFPRINADNTVSALDAATFRTAIGAGTGGGSVTSVSGTGTVSGISLSGTVTTSGSLTLGGTLDLSAPPAIGGTTPNTGAFTSVTSTSAAGVLTRAAATQDGVEMIGRAGGTLSYKVSLTPTTLTASRTLTLPDNSGTILTTGATVTVAQGGTGATTLTGVVKGNGTSAFTAGTVSLTSEVAGTLPVGNGGTGTATAFTAGSVVFAGASGVYSQNNSQVFWDTTNSRFGIGTNSPNRKLEIAAGTGGPPLRLTNTNSNSGIEIITSTTTYSWLLGAQFNVSGAFEITPSTAVGGTTFSTPTAVFTQTGLVGIGTTAPAEKLSVAGAIRVHTASSVGFTSDTKGGLLDFVPASNNVRVGYVPGTSGVNTGILSFVVGAGTEVSRFDSDGTFRVKGAGTAGSTDAFQVSGSAPASAVSLNSAGNFLVGGTAARATTAGSASIQLFNGTAPAGTLTNGVSLYSSSGDLNFMDSAGNGFKVGYRNLPPVGTKTASYTLATGDVGKYVQLSTGGAIVIPTSTFAEGDAITLFNNTTGNITITCSAPTAYIAGTNTVKTSMTLATRGVATILFISSTLCVVTGNVT